MTEHPTHPSKSPSPIRVKFLAKAQPGSDYSEWLGRFPKSVPLWGRCEYTFEQDSRDYDWLVVYDDLPARNQERFTLWEETLACPRAQTLLVTTEPSTIKVYGNGYTRQFGAVLTSQEPWAIKHPNAIFSQTGLIWFYGIATAPPAYGKPKTRAAYDFLVANPPENKTAEVSTVCSSKKQKHTLHHARVEFTRKLKSELPSLEVFGHGVRYIKDKSEALDAFKYHIAIENHVYRHHWTEKLSDSFLGLCLPFYHGCPNVFDYFPEESILPINIHSFEESLERIRQAIRDREFEKRLPAIREARRLVLQEYSLFPLISRLIEERTPSGKVATASSGSETILSRHAWRRRNPLNAVAFGMEKARIQMRYFLSR